MDVNWEFHDVFDIVDFVCTKLAYILHVLLNNVMPLSVTQIIILINYGHVSIKSQEGK